MSNKKIKAKPQTSADKESTTPIQDKNPENKQLEMLKTKIVNEAIKLANKKIGHIGYLVDYAKQYETILNNGKSKRA